MFDRCLCHDCQQAQNRLQLAKRWSFQQKTLVCSVATCDSPLSMVLSYHRWALYGKKANRSVSLLEKQPWYRSRTRWEQPHLTSLPARM